MLNYDDQTVSQASIPWNQTRVIGATMVLLGASFSVGSLIWGAALAVRPTLVYGAPWLRAGPAVAALGLVALWLECFVPWSHSRRQQFHARFQVAVALASAAGGGLVAVIALSGPSPATPTIWFLLLSTVPGWAVLGVGAAFVIQDYSGFTPDFDRFLGHLAIALGVILFGWFGPNAADALHAGKRGWTMATMRSIMVAAQGYAEDHGAYPNVASMAELEKLLVDDYIRELPATDGWGWPLEYRGFGDRGHLIRSSGRDGIFEHSEPTAYPFQTVERYSGDLVLSTISGCQWPEGTMGW